ncbi:MAG: hypothetical protein ABSA71_15380 [Desulfomonilia bacterium]|jgi:hypothetical protein
MTLTRTRFPIKEDKAPDIDPTIDPETDIDQEHKTNIPTTKQRGFPKGSPRPPRIAERWQENTEEAFYAWLEDVKPMILTRSGRYEVFRPTPEQKTIIKAVFTQENGKLKHSMILSIQPRRHGKSTVFAIIALFFFCSRKNYTISLLGNNDTHTDRTMLRKLKSIIQHTGGLRIRIDPDRDILHDCIRQETWGNQIIKQGVSSASAFGERINLLWVSDLHAAPDISIFNAVQASLLDSEDSLILIDSNADSIGGPVHGLEEEAMSDPSIFCRHLEYKDFEEFTEKAPAWIDRSRAKRIQRTALEADYQRDILGKRSSVANALFPEILIRAAMDSYKIPVLDIKDLAHGRPYKVGAGLDRAKLLSPIMGGDHSVLTTVAKVAQTSGEPEYFILDMHDFTLNLSKAIKARIIENHKRYTLTNVVLESFETVDLLPYLAEMQISHESIHATDVAQNTIFPEFYRIVKDGRLHIPANCTQLADEMRSFIYTAKKHGQYSFGHSSSQFHDDAVYATAWAIFSLRNEILSMYQLDLLDCQNQSSLKRALCFLFGGSKVMHCSEGCAAFHSVQDMHQDFLAFNQLDSELNLVEFFKAYVQTKDTIKQYQVL